MKLLITSPDALFDKKSGKEFPGAFEALDHFLEFDKDNAVVVVSISKANLKGIDEKYNPIPIKDELRGSPKLVEVMTKHLECTYSDVLVLGCKNHDVYTASNSKVLLLRADYAEPNNPDSILYANAYGLQINSPASLKIFFNHYFSISTPWFYNLKVDESTTLYALTDANYKDKSADYAKLCNDFKNCLKHDDDTNLYSFTIYFLISTYMLFKDVSTIDYWALYPSSTGDTNEDMEFFLKKARQSFGNRTSKPLLIRHTKSQKRHFKNKAERLKDGCKSQFDSITLNPYYKNKLEGRDVCIIDDFTTWGSSCETIRHLLLKAGVKRIIFIALGKFGYSYFKYDYEITGDVFAKYEYKEKSEAKELGGEQNKKSNMDFLKSINEIM